MTTLTGNSTTNEDEHKRQKRSDAEGITSLLGGNIKIEGLTDVFWIITKAVVMFIPLPAVAFSTGTMRAEGGLAPEVIKEKINRVKDGIADKMKKENATEK